MTRHAGPFPWEDAEEAAQEAAQESAASAAQESAAAAAQESAPAAAQEVYLAAEPSTPAASAASPAASAAPPAASPASPAASAPSQRPLIRKEYYSISEVADLVGLPAHVLRYWESQFSVLNPSKNRSGNRVYQRKEIRLILLVKQLLHDEKYTVEGAKQRLDQLRRGGALQEATAHALDEQLVQTLRAELASVSELLAPEAG